MDAADFFLLVLTPIGLCVLVGIVAAYVLCTYAPPSDDCTAMAAWIIGLSFLLGVALTYGTIKHHRDKDGS